MTISDSDCIRRCLNGHRDDFRILIERYEAPLAAVLRGRLRGRGALAEAVHDAFVRAYALLPRKRGELAFFPWLVGVALRVVKEQHRANRRGRVELSETPAHTAAPPLVFDDDSELTAAVLDLAEIYRDVVLLRYFANWSCAEVAATLGLPIGTVTKRLSRAYEMLRNQLGAALCAANREECR